MCGWLGSVLFTPKSQPIQKHEEFGYFRVLIPDSCILDGLRTSFDLDIVEFDFPMKQLKASSYILFKDNRMPDEVLTELHSYLSHCLVDTRAKSSSPFMLNEELSKYFFISEKTPVYITIENGLAEVLYNSKH